MNRLGKSLQTERKAKHGRKKTGTILQIPNLRSKVFCVFFFFLMYIFLCLKTTHLKCSHMRRGGSNCSKS